MGWMVIAVLGPRGRVVGDHLLSVWEGEPGMGESDLHLTESHSTPGGIIDLPGS
jgi:hypothetical protein